MTQERVTDEQYGRLHSRLDDLLRRVKEGSLSYEVVMSELQRVVEGALINGMFISPHAQLALARKRNDECGWGFAGKEFAALEKAIPAWPEGRLSAIILDVSLDSVSETFEEAWRFAASVQPAHWRWDSLKSDAEHLRVLDGIKHRLGLRWVVVDLGANWDKTNGIRPQDVRNPQTSPHSAILWAASYFPKWVQAMDGKNIPYVWLPGHQVTIPGGGAWADVPSLSWFGVFRRVELGADDASGRSGGWAVPVSRE